MIRVTRKKSGHLIEITRDDGTRDISWDWKQLLDDVREACEAYESANKGKVLTVAVPVDVHEVKPKKTAAKKPAAKKAAPKKAPAKKKKEIK